MSKLNVQSPTLYARVSDHIPLIINFIEKLIHDGFAYSCSSGKKKRLFFFIFETKKIFIKVRFILI